MTVPGDRHIPEDLQPLVGTATRLVAAAIVYLVVDAVVLYLLMSGSQAVLALLVEDGLEAIGPAVFLITKRRRSTGTSVDFPYGHQRDVTLGALASALALLGFGLVLFGFSAFSLIGARHATVPPVQIGALQIWQGWLVIPWLAFTAFPPRWIGRRIQRVAHRINDRILYVIGDLMTADWQSSLAGLVGVLGIAAGMWWLDPLAALLISFWVVRDGVRNTRHTAAMLLDRQPTEMGSQETVDLVGRIEHEARSEAWIGRAEVRLRDNGQFFVGDVAVEIGDATVKAEQLASLEERLLDLDWRLQDVLISPVKQFPSPDEPE